MNDLIMPHNVGVKNALENMKELLDLYKKVIGNYRPLLDGERYLTDQEVAQILKVSRRTLQEYRNDGVLPYILLGGKVLYLCGIVIQNLYVVRGDKVLEGQTVSLKQCLLGSFGSRGRLAIVDDVILTRCECDE